MLRTPSVVGNDLEMEYDYDDNDDGKAAKPARQTETSALLATLESQDADGSATGYEEGYLASQDVRFLCFRTRHVPWLLFLSDFIISNGAGMTINFFPLFFLQEYGLTPIHISALFISQPLIVMTLSFAAQLDITATPSATALVSFSTPHISSVASVWMLRTPLSPRSQQRPHA